jgi:hypothetical protein
LTWFLHSRCEVQLLIKDPADLTFVPHISATLSGLVDKISNRIGQSVSNRIASLLPIDLVASPSARKSVVDLVSPVSKKSGGDDQKKSGEDDQKKSGGDGQKKSGGDGQKKSGGDGQKKGKKECKDDRARTKLGKQKAAGVVDEDGSQNSDEFQNDDRF